MRFECAANWLFCTGGCLMLEAELVDAGAGTQGPRTSLVNSRIWSLKFLSGQTRGLSVLLAYRKKHAVPLNLSTWKGWCKTCVPKLISSPVGRTSISVTISCTEQPLNLLAEQLPCDEQGLQAGTKQSFQGQALQNRWLNKIKSLYIHN